MLFTFQYVSIKTSGTNDSYTVSVKFTFQYVSIKTNTVYINDVCQENLHSNMFLLRLNL